MENKIQTKIDFDYMNKPDVLADKFLSLSSGTILPREEAVCRLAFSLSARAVELQGADGQIDKIMEECSELITALLHFKQNRVGVEAVVEELAGVFITFFSGIVIFDRQEYFQRKVSHQLQKFSKEVQSLEAKRDEVI